MNAIYINPEGEIVPDRRVLETFGTVLLKMRTTKVAGVASLAGLSYAQNSTFYSLYTLDKIVQTIWSLVNI
jgi:hypothetical protein